MGLKEEKKKRLCRLQRFGGPSPLVFSQIWPWRIGYIAGILRCVINPVLRFLNIMLRRGGFSEKEVVLLYRNRPCVVIGEKKRPKLSVKFTQLPF